MYLLRMRQEAVCYADLEMSLHGYRYLFALCAAQLPPNLGMEAKKS
jgi:hypothetical protein